MTAPSRSLLLLGFALGIASCGRPTPTLEHHGGLAQGTTYSIQWWSAEPPSAATVAEAVEAELERLDALLSNYREDSVIERFNTEGTEAPQALPTEVVQLLATASRVHAATDGCFDPSVRPLVKLWGFDGESPAAPGEEELLAARERIGFSKLEIASDGRVQKPAYLEIDTSSIGQGYSVLRLARTLEGYGITDYLVEIGGELMGRGHKPDGSAWRVGVEEPDEASSTIRHVLSLPGEPALAVITSGSYRHFFDSEGRRYSHILDPRTGFPVDHTLRSVTVVGEDAALAAAWGTALMCLGPTAGADAAERAGVAALLLFEEDGETRERRTSAFERLKLD